MNINEKFRDWYEGADFEDIIFVAFMSACAVALMLVAGAVFIRIALGAA